MPKVMHAARTRLEFKPNSKADVCSTRRKITPTNKGREGKVSYEEIRLDLEGCVGCGQLEQCWKDIQEVLTVPEIL